MEFELLDCKAFALVVRKPPDILLRQMTCGCSYGFLETKQHKTKQNKNCVLDLAMT